MGLRKDFLVHKGKTVESFRLVRADISSINISIEHLKNILQSVESRISIVDNEVSNLQKVVDKNTSDINIQNNLNLTVQSKLDNINKSISNIITVINSFKSSINKIIPKNQKMLKDISSNRNAIKKLFLISTELSFKNKQLNSALIKSQSKVKILKNLLYKKLGIINRRIKNKPITKLHRKKIKK